MSKSATWFAETLNMKSYSMQKNSVALTVGLLLACGANAYDVTLNTNWPTMTFHGFASQGFLASSDYNYLASDTRNGSFQFTELGLNASVNPFPHTRIAVQGFDFDVGDVNKYQPFLDYALIEYTFSDALGVRAGRIRRPGGLYNHIQDVDLARTSVLLPQGLYDARWRDFFCSIDGGEFFGTLSLGRAGSLGYELYAGMVNMSDDGGVAAVVKNEIYGTPVSFVGMDECQVYGSQLWWNTPLDGLRAGVCGGYIADFGYKLNAGPSQIHIEDNIPFVQGSLEYVWKRWTFQAECFTYNLSGNQYFNYPPGYFQSDGSVQKEAWYVSASRRFNKWLEAGVYYTEDYENTDTTGNSLTYQKDAALSFRFDPTDWWVFKIEGHYIHGTGLLDDSAHNPSQDNRGWFLLAVKTTFSF